MLLAKETVHIYNRLNEACLGLEELVDVEHPESKVNTTLDILYEVLTFLRENLDSDNGVIDVCYQLEEEDDE